MSGKHTPGPWGVVSDETVTVRDTGDGCIASCGWLTSRFTGPRRSSSEVHANARLIAAAPEMLEALILALPYVETAEADEGYKPGAVAKISAAIRAAIAKAEGEP